MDFLQSYGVITAQQSHSRNGDFCPCSLMSEHILPMFIPPCLCFLLTSSLISISWKYFQQTSVKTASRGIQGPFGPFSTREERRKEGRKEGGWRTDRKCSTGTRRCKTLHVFAPSGDVFWRPVGDMLGVCMCVQEARSQTHMACELHQNGWSRRGDDGKTVKF